MDIDLIDPDRWTSGIPHEQFEWLRRDAPVFWHESDDPTRAHRRARLRSSWINGLKRLPVTMTA